MKKAIIGILALSSLSTYAGNFTSSCEEKYSDLAYHCHYMKKSGLLGDDLNGTGVSLYLNQAKELAKLNCVGNTGENCKFVYCSASFGNYSKTIIPGGTQSQGGSWDGKREYMKQKRKDKKEFKALREAARNECPRT